MVTWAGMGPSVCAHWTMADHCGHMGEQQARQTFGGKNEHFSGQAFRESTGLRARSMCFSTPGFQKTQPTCQGFYAQLSRSLLHTASSERERVEYLMEEEGKIYAGTHSKPRGRFSPKVLNDVFIKLQLSRPWVYGQFSPTVLPAVCHLLHTSPYLRPAERANPVKVCSTFRTN